MRTRCIFYAAVLVSALPLTVAAQNIEGSWRAWFACPGGGGSLAMRFDFKSEGNRLTGVAHMAKWFGDDPFPDGKMVHKANWLRDAPISNGIIDGNSISFTVTGKYPWVANGVTWRSSGYPRFKFSGTIQGRELKLSVVWDRVLIYGTRGAHVYHMNLHAQKLTETQ